MRSLWALLAVANLRWARVAMQRSDGLYAEGGAAFAEAEQGLATAVALSRQGRVST